VKWIGRFALCRAANPGLELTKFQLALSSFMPTELAAVDAADLKSRLSDLRRFL